MKYGPSGSSWLLGTLALTAIWLATGSALPGRLAWLGGGLFIAAFFWARAGLHVRARVQITPRYVPFDGTAQVHVTLHNPVRWPSVWVQVGCALPPGLVSAGDGGHVSPVAARVPFPPPLPAAGPGTAVNWVEALRPRSAAEVATAVRGVRRGVYRLPPLRVTVEDPAGVWCAVQEFPVHEALVVFPRLQPVPVEIFAPGQPFGSLRVSNPAFEDSSSLRRVRDYQPGDSLRRIHWRQSAKLGRLQVKEYELTATTSCLILLDPRPVADEVFETMVSVAASIGAEAFRLGFEAELDMAHPAQAATDRRVKADITRLLTAAAAAVPLTVRRGSDATAAEGVWTGSGLHQRIRSLGAGGQVIVVTSVPVPMAIVEAVRRWRRAGRPMSLVLVLPMDAARPDAEDRTKLRTAGVPAFSVTGHWRDWRLHPLDGTGVRPA